MGIKSKGDEINHQRIDDAEELIEEPVPDTEEVREKEFSGDEKKLSHITKQWLARMTDLCFPAVVFDSLFNILWRNRPFSSAFEKKKEMIGCSLDDIFRIENDRTLSEMVVRPLKDKSGYCWQGRVHSRDRAADNYIANLLLFPIDFNDIDNPGSYLGLVDDISREYKQILRNTFLSLLEASKLKDNDTGHHIERVNRYSFLMAKRLLFDSRYSEVDEDFIENIGFLAAMHDVGKIGTPDDILNKKGSLEPWEMEVMKEHTKNGAFILSTYPNPMARQIALSHHEWWDGSGYPYGLMEGMIPLSSRIVAVADVYDALRSKRSYKDKMSHKKALEIMEEQSGTHFDPELMKIFLQHNKVFAKAYDELSDEA